MAIDSRMYPAIKISNKAMDNKPDLHSQKYAVLISRKKNKVAKRSLLFFNGKNNFTSHTFQGSTPSGSTFLKMPAPFYGHNFFYRLLSIRCFGYVCVRLFRLR